MTNYHDSERNRFCSYSIKVRVTQWSSLQGGWGLFLVVEKLGPSYISPCYLERSCLMRSIFVIETRCGVRSYVSLYPRQNKIMSAHKYITTCVRQEHATLCLVWNKALCHCFLCDTDHYVVVSCDIGHCAIVSCVIQTIMWLSLVIKDILRHYFMWG